MIPSTLCCWLTPLLMESLRCQCCVPPPQSHTRGITTGASLQTQSVSSRSRTTHTRSSGATQARQGACLPALSALQGPACLRGAGRGQSFAAITQEYLGRPPQPAKREQPVTSALIAAGVRTALVTERLRPLEHWEVATQQHSIANALAVLWDQPGSASPTVTWHVTTKGFDQKQATVGP